MRQLPSENSTPIELLVSANEAMLRLDQFMTKRLTEFSRSRLQQLIRDGFVRLNDSTSRPSQIVRGGDKIELAVVTRQLRKQTDVIAWKVGQQADYHKRMTAKTVREGVASPDCGVIRAGSQDSLIECILHRV